jgi:hypothetical protein
MLTKATQTDITFRNAISPGGSIAGEAERSHGIRKGAIGKASHARRLAWPNNAAVPSSPESTPARTQRSGIGPTPLSEEQRMPGKRQRAILFHVPYE